ncbi:signal peptidase II [Termitidicoccus mucosus]|uniref:Lipoprotein signal peptidase n=1 Tax=Termitidicoccus mucosus TaxID=1184151 RepID=A0A178IPE4_9BACT|nr:signal peptidase II [Opitutaceae bacterium TSB47]
MDPSVTSVSRGPGTPPPPTRMQRLLAYRWFHLCALAVFTLDQATKIWIHRTLDFGTYGPPGHIEIIPGFFNLVHVGNTGAAWSLFAGRSTLLAVLALGTLAAIFFWRRTLGLRQRAVQVGFGLLCGGIAGNLVDRMIHKHVIDFLDFHFGSYIYPTFNIADAGIVSGVALYLILAFRKPVEKT